MYVHRVYAKMYVRVHTRLFTSAPVALGVELIWEADIDISFKFFVLVAVIKTVLSDHFSALIPQETVFLLDVLSLRCSIKAFPRQGVEKFIFSQGFFFFFFSVTDQLSDHNHS